MQENDYKDFDRKLRSMLSDAEMDAPGDAWSEIETRLRPLKAPSFPLWARYAFAAAACCVFAIVILLVREVPHMAQLAEIVDLEAEAAHTSADFAATDAARALSPVATESQRDAARASSPVAAESQGDAAPGDKASAAHTPEKASAGVCPAAASPLLSADAGHTTAEAEGSSQQTTGNADEDPFAAMEREDRLAEAKSAKRQPPSLGFAGEFGGSPLGMTANTVKTVKGVNRNLVADNTITQTDYSSFGFPVSISFEALFPLSKTLSLSTGLSYSLLTDTYSSTFRQDSGHSYKGSTLHTMHYIGIPVDLQVNLVKSKTITFYAFAGGSVEYCVCDHYNFTSAEISYSCNKKVNAPQFSVGAGLGVDFRFSRSASVFLDPSARYYFQWDQPKSIRTSRPLLINAQLGMRFRIPTGASSGQEI